MSKSKSAAEFAGDNSDPVIETEEAPKKETRYRTVGGIKHPIVRTFYCPKRNVVMEEYEMTKIVTDNFTRERLEIKIRMRGKSLNEELQKRYVVDKTVPVEVDIYDV